MTCRVCVGWAQGAWIGQRLVKNGSSAPSEGHVAGAKGQAQTIKSSVGNEPIWA